MSDLALRAIEDNAMLGCCLHELQEVPVMFLRSMAIDAYIIMSVNNARKTVHYLVHVHLKDIPGHLQTTWHTQKPVPATVSVECGQVGGFLIEVDAPETVLSISLLKHVAPLS